MRLSELKPYWMRIGGNRIALFFQCPHCIQNKRKHPVWLTCFFVPVESVTKDYEGSQYELFQQEIERNKEVFGDIDPSHMVPCRKGFAWMWRGSDFEDTSITPSIDASNSGHWHGHITDGQIVGGLE